MRMAWPAILCLLLLSGASHAECIDPLIPYNRCTEACPDMVEKPLAASNCINVCLAQYEDDTDAYYECQKAEREAEEKARTERDNKLRGIEEAKVITVSTVEGMIWLTNPEGLAKHIALDDIPNLEPGDTLKSGPDSSAVLTLKEGSRLQLGPDSQFTYVDGEIMDVFDVWIVRYDLITGKVRFFPHRDNTKFIVKTPHATVTHRETDFIVETDNETDMTAVYLHEGILDVNTTRGETSVLNTGEMMTIDSDGKTVKSPLSIEDWDGLVKNIETGEEFTPSWKIPPAEETSFQDTLNPGRKQSILFIVLFIIIMAVAITAGSIIRARRKKKQ
ncbi:FecR domain-containing protein [Candidatus Woesearchaeota archaeon]|nr:FecR domain-containing protein [Candidatus Woesearchaeota archaeon]